MLLLLNDKFKPRRHPFKLDELIVGPIRGEQRARVLEVLELGLGRPGVRITELFTAAPRITSVHV